MMINRLRIAAAALLVSWPAAAHALEYSANSVFHWSHGADEINKVYVSNGKVRIDLPGGKAHELMDLTKNTDYLVVTGQKFIPAQGPVAARLRSVRYSAGANLCAKISTPAAPATCKKLGMETLNGHVVEKWQLSRTMLGRRLESTNWIDPALNAVVKVVRDGRVSYELLNVRLGPQPAGLFAIPQGLPIKQLPDMAGVPSFKRGPR